MCVLTRVLTDGVCGTVLCAPQVTWAADTRDRVNVLTIDDYFGELSLFVNKKLAYTARAVTHLDAFRLDRAEFIAVMRSHPAGAVHVADLMGSVLPSRLAKQVRAWRDSVAHAALTSSLSPHPSHTSSSPSPSPSRAPTLARYGR